MAETYLLVGCVPLPQCVAWSEAAGRDYIASYIAARAYTAIAQVVDLFIDVRIREIKDVMYSIG
jgi:hypothetical protein